ncbi:hypothetical protein [Pedobacter rhodius]|uniref:Uncharacterized protein n=1 Tax=Pedobacter rhodius TaxID=3004098 RepID=A0ABT4KSS1_9SPHI|nr:hypothetical protein [Pedobacter sp. SJ11]MCZ4221973.1 hypothetical protein [Pedobacter sp. SJ11]
MENQDKNTVKPHPKPSDDAQSLVETIIPSTEDKASTTTQVEQPEIKESEKAVDKEKDTDEEELPGNTDEKEAEKHGNDEGDKIETVAP